MLAAGYGTHGRGSGMATETGCGRRVLVAGATGYLGRHVVRAMHDAGYRVRALARDPARLREARPLCDEVFVGHATRPETLGGLCDGVDIVFSSLGVRSFRRRPTFWEVDYRANLNIFERASAAGVRHAIFISLAHAPELRGRYALVEARERVANTLRASGMRWTILRPTGYFNDMADYFAMARRGTAWIIGDGRGKINPIHGADLAAEAVRAVVDPSLWDAGEDVGGPETFTLRELAELAFAVLGRPPRIRTISPALLRGAAALIRPVNGNVAALLRLAALIGQLDFVGAPRGSHRLRAFFEELQAGATTKR